MSRKWHRYRHISQIEWKKALALGAGIEIELELRDKIFIHTDIGIE